MSDLEFRTFGTHVNLVKPGGGMKTIHRCDDVEDAKWLCEQLNTNNPGDDLASRILAEAKEAIALDDEFFAQEVSTQPLWKDPIRMTDDTQNITPLHPSTQPSEPTAEIKGRRVTISVNRSHEAASGGWRKVEASMEFDLAPGTHLEEVPGILAYETGILTSHVLTELGLPFTYDEETKRVTEVFPNSTVVQSPGQPQQAAPMQAPPQVQQPMPPQQLVQNAQQQQVPQQGQPNMGQPSWEDIAARLQNGTLDQAYYDNRGQKKNPNQPDFNTKATQADGKRKGFWIYSQYPNAACPPHLLPIVDPNGTGGQ